MRATIAWSYNLLDVEEKRYFRMLSAFAGGAAFEDAEQVARSLNYPVEDLPDVVTALADKNLLKLSGQGGDGLRVELLETIREYGLECLEQNSESETVRLVHAEYFEELSRRAYQELYGADHNFWVRRLDREQNNFRAALQWCAGGVAMNLAYRLTVSLSPYWIARSYMREGRVWTEQLLATLPNNATDQSIAIDLTHYSGVFKMHQGDYLRASELFMASLRLSRTAEDRRRVARGLNSMGGVTTHMQAESERCMCLFKESISIYRELGDDVSVANTLHNMGEVARASQNYKLAEQYLGESLNISTRSKNQHAVAATSACLAHVARDRGNYQRALSLYVQALEVFSDIGDRRAVAYCLEALATLASALHTNRTAAVLFGAAEALEESIAFVMPPSERIDYPVRVDAARAALGDFFAAAWEEGRSLDQDAAVKLALKFAREKI